MAAGEKTAVLRATLYYNHDPIPFIFFRFSLPRLFWHSMIIFLFEKEKWDLNLRINC